MFRPLQALENRALGTQYVNVLATYPAFRRRGVGDAAAGRGASGGRGTRGLSLIVADRNAAARRLYEALRLRRGGAAADRQGRLGERRAEEWVLMLGRRAEALQIAAWARYIPRWRVLAFP